MKNLKKQSAVVLCALFATMQISFANIETGLGAGNGGASIIDGGAGFKSITGANTGNVNLNFDANSHVKWDTLNVNKGEALNFNAVDGATGLTILNTVNQGMSKFAGNVNANSGIGKLIISNPNGVLFDGAKFSAAGDVMITAKDMSAINVNNLSDGTWATLYDPATKDLIKVQILNDSNFNIGGEFKILAPKIVAENSTINAGSGLKLITANGSDYIAQSMKLDEKKGVTSLKAMNINGNVEIVNDMGALSIYDGTDITGDLKAEVGGIALVYGEDADHKVHVSGDTDLTGHGQQLILRNAKVDGNVKMSNDGGALEINNATIGKNANLTTTGWQPVNHKKYNHYVHVNGNTDIGGNLNIESSQNIHIGNYKVTNDPYASNKTTNAWQGDLLDGKLTVGGDLTAKVTDGGHIMTTIDTSAKNIDFTAKSHKEGDKIYGGNILSDDKATLSADTYKFKSDGYIGGLKTSGGYKVDDKVVHMMEEYQFIPDDTTSHEYMNINGGTISKIETPEKSAAGNNVQVYIKSKNDLLVNGANAGDINLVAPDKKITITGDVNADNINVDGRTGTLQLDFPKRNFTTNYTNLRDGEVKTIKPNDEITYELTNAPKAYNSPEYKQVDGSDRTYLVGPGKPDDPTPPPKTDQDPDPNDSAKLLKNWAPDDPTAPAVNTPVAFAADLDDDQEDAGVRKNVDGSVTVVRAFPMMGS